MRLAFVIAIVLCPLAASAKPKVALTAFAGDTKDHARSAVADVIDGDLSIVDEPKGAMNEQKLANLSKTLDVDGVVHGKVSNEGDKSVLRVSLFVHGKKSATFYVPYTSLTSKKFRRTVHDRLLAKLEPKPTKEAKDDDEKPAKKEKKVAQADDDDKPVKAAKRVAHRDDADADDAPAVDKAVALVSPKQPRLERAAAVVEAGASVSARVLTYSSRGFDQAPPSYHNAGVPGARVAGELYPAAAIAPNSWAAGIGVAGSYDKTMALSVATPDPGVKLAVDQHVWSVGARYRAGWVTFAADYGHRAFEVKRTMGTIDMPDVDYAGFEPGVDVRVPLGKTFALRAGGRAMLLKSAGPIQGESSYGRAHIAGGNAMVGLDVAVAPRVTLRFAGEAAELKMTFYGTGAETNARDGDPTTIDVGGATDKYFGGSATLAVFY